jgi:carbon monoxide dehydrogenase subunit G
VDLQHTFTVPIGIDAAWEAFTDIERIAPCLPGAAITSVDGDEFTGTAKVKLGPISLQYAGKGTWVSRDRDAYSAVIEAQGKDKRGNGTAGATISAHLEPDGESTRVVVDTELKITGRPAQFGRGVISEVGSKLLDQFAACLTTRLVEPAPADVKPADVKPADAKPAEADAAPQEGPGPVAAARTAEPVAAPEPTKAAYPGPVSPGATNEPAELDLGGVVGPVLLKRLVPLALGLLALALLLRRLRHR